MDRRTVSRNHNLTWQISFRTWMSTCAEENDLLLHLNKLYFSNFILQLQYLLIQPYQIHNNKKMIERDHKKNSRMSVSTSRVLVNSTYYSKLLSEELPTSQLLLQLSLLHCLHTFVVVTTGCTKKMPDVS
jgi:hypothetical protein